MRKILLVDDEPHVLDALKRQLRGRFEVFTATGGPAALALMVELKNLEVIVSDMRMPDIDGIQFLDMARDVCPEAVRMMLTGNAEQRTVVDAVNRGAIFRFVNKPCETDKLAEAIEACGRQHDLIVAERELLENTLTGAVRMLMEILALVQPEAFGRAQTAKNRAALLADHFGATNRWAIELATLFSRMGTIVVPPEVLQKSKSGQPLTAKERSLIDRIPTLGAELLEKIPRLESVAEIVRTHPVPFNAMATPTQTLRGEGIPLGARIVKVLNDLADLENRGLSLQRAFFVLRTHAGLYDPRILAAAEDLLTTAESEKTGYPIALADLKVGLKLRADLVTAGGSLLVTSGTMITPTLLERLLNYTPAQAVEEPIYVDSLSGKDAPST